MIVPSEAASAAGAAKRARPAPSGVLGLRVALNVFAWWALNVVFNLCNKICLNTWPHPWALATLHLHGEVIKKPQPKLRGSHGRAD